MVKKIGFICEGATEKLLVDSLNFHEFLATYNCKSVFSVDAEGNGNLLPRNISPFIKTLHAKKAEFIFVLTDLDDDQCITQTKERISAPAEVTVIISVKAIESWFLADSKLLTEMCGKAIVFETPEKERNPFKTLRAVFTDNNVRGLGPTKTVAAKKLLDSGFSLLRAHEHDACNSLKYFSKKLLDISEPPSQFTVQ